MKRGPRGTENLHKIIAEYPTITRNGIYSSTTGRFPTEYCIKEILESKSTKIDSIIEQIGRGGYNQRFIGYIEWIEMYNKYFNHSLSIPNIDHTNTEENHFNEHVYPYINGSEAPDILWIHGESIDEAFHFAQDRWGWLERAFNIVRGVMHEIYAQMDIYNTLFIVYGDHGVLNSPILQHGGNTIPEREAGAFIFSHMPLALGTYKSVGVNNNNVYQRLLLRKLNASIDDENEIYHIDLPATLAALLSIPIPYNSLGGVMNLVFKYRVSQTFTSFMLQSLFRNTLSLLNIKRFLMRYSEITDNKQDIKYSEEFNNQVIGMKEMLYDGFINGKQYIQMEELGMINNLTEIDEELYKYNIKLLEINKRITEIIRNNAEYFRYGLLSHDTYLFWCSFSCLSICVILAAIWTLAVYKWINVYNNNLQQSMNIPIPSFPMLIIFGNLGTIFIIIIFYLSMVLISQYLSLIIAFMLLFWHIFCLLGFLRNVSSQVSVTKAYAKLTTIVRNIPFSFNNLFIYRKKV